MSKWKYEACTFNHYEHGERIYPTAKINAYLAGMAARGWRLHSVITPSVSTGSDGGDMMSPITLIMEREIIAKPRKPAEATP